MHCPDCGETIYEEDRNHWSECRNTSVRCEWCWERGIPSKMVRVPKIGWIHKDKCLSEFNEE